MKSFFWVERIVRNVFILSTNKFCKIICSSKNYVQKIGIKGINTKLRRSKSMTYFGKHPVEV